MTNREIAKVLRFTSQLLELHDENPFKVKSYASAAFKIDKNPIPISNLSIAELEKVDGIGKSIAPKIKELSEKGMIEDLQKMLSLTPEGVIRMLNIKGIGPKKVGVIWRELQIETIGDLLYACTENRLVEVKGFGEKTQEQIKKALEYSISNEKKFHYATLEALAYDWVSQLEHSGKFVHVSTTGELRRKCEIIEGIELIVEPKDGITNEEILSVFGLVHADTSIEEGVVRGIKVLKFQTITELPVFLYISEKRNFYNSLFLTTASEDHLTQLNISDLKPSSSEADIYSSLNLAYIEPELREGLGEIEKARNGNLPHLVEMKDLKGIIHNHSTYSDGVNTLEDMAKYCKKAGYEYLAICDHSQSAFYAGGLKPDKVLQQHAEIDELNIKLAPFKIYKGIESDILSDGSLDYPEEILSKFDLIVASVHSNLKMNEEKAMTRLLRAIENPYTTILGHSTGRLLLMREGYPIDHKKIIEACAANNVIIELNANPYRLDMDWRWIQYALDKGVMISINPDAHRIEAFHDMHFGVCAARKGGLTKDMTFNALSRAELDEYLMKKHTKLHV